MTIPNTPELSRIQAAQENARGYILDSLGADAIDVELTEKQLDHAIRQAVLMFDKYQPLLCTEYHEVIPTQTLVVDYSENPRVRYVTDVDWQISENFRTNFIGSFAAAGEFAYGRGMRLGRTYFEYSMGAQRQRFFTGTQPDYYWDELERKLYLYNPATKREATVNVLVSLTVADITPAQNFDFLRLCTAYAKQTLARIIGKFGDIPGPQSSISNDGEALKQEASQVIEEVHNMLKSSMRSVPPMRHIG